MNKIFTVLAIFFICIGSVYGKVLNLNEISQATCRVRVSGAAGSGTAVHQDQNFVYILTNAHVVGSSNSATVEFFRNGWKTDKINGQVIKRWHSGRSSVDFAIIQVSKSAIGYTPRIIPFAPYEYQAKTNEYIASVGHPSARWASGWEGHTIREQSDRIFFSPPPVGGQSGSCICVNIDGDTYVAGVVTWQIGNDGAGVTIRTLRDLIAGRTVYPTLVPDYYHEVIYRDPQFTILPNRKARGNDGELYPIYYDENWKLRAILPWNKSWVKIIEWNVNCSPGGICPPSNGGPPNQNPWGPNRPPSRPPQNPNPPEGLPPDFGDLDPNPPGDLPPPDINPPGNQPPKPPDFSSELDKLRKENAELTKQLKEANDTIESLEKNIASNKKIIDELTNKRDQLLDSNKNLAEANEEFLNKVDNLDKEISKREKQVEDLQKVLNNSLKEKESLENQNTELQSQINSQVTKNESLQNTTTNLVYQRNFIGSGLILTILSVLLLWVGKPAWRFVKPYLTLKLGKARTERVEILLEHLANRLEQLEKNQDKDSDSGKKEGPAKTPHPFDHPNYKAPPGPVDELPKWEYQVPPPPLFTSSQVDSVGRQEIPPMPTGLDPVPPQHPSHIYTNAQLWEAIQEIAHRHPNEPLLRSVPNLVRSILNSPRKAL